MLQHVHYRVAQAGVFLTVDTNITMVYGSSYTAGAGNLRAARQVPNGAHHLPSMKAFHGTVDEPATKAVMESRIEKTGE